MFDFWLQYKLIGKYNQQKYETIRVGDVVQVPPR